MRVHTDSFYFEIKYGTIMKKLSRVIICILVSVIPFLAFAHPGHDHAEGSGGFTITHYLTTPVHLITSIAVVAIVIGILRAVNIKNQQSRN